MARRTAWDLRKFALIAIVSLSLLLIFLQRAYASNNKHLIQGNEVWGTQQHPAKAGGNYSGCTIEIINNIFYDTGAGGDAFAAVPSGNPIFAANDFYMPGGASVGTCPTVEAFMSVAPGFVNYGDSTGGGADFHIRSDSTLKSAGVPLPQVTDDFYGNSRGTTAYSVGAAK